MVQRIYYISDLHLEFEDNNLLKIYLNKEYFDLYINSYIVLAGDICCYNYKNKFKTFFEYISKKFKRVIYIAGNHEYYKKTLDDNKIKELLKSFDNVYFLQDSYITFLDDNITFYGTTLWTRLSENNEINNLVESSLNDYKLIRYPYTYKKITRNLTGEMFEMSYEELKNFLTNKPDGKIIIVSHHLPLFQLICDKFKNDELNSGFASDLYDELIKFNFDCWFFGHTHFTIRYEINNIDSKSIPFLSNSRGYNSDNIEFDEDKFVLL